MKRKYAKIVIRIRNTDNQIVTFLVFVLMSSVLWFLNALSKDYITEIETPIEMVGVPRNLRPHLELPTSISTQVSGRGFTLLRYKTATPSIPFKLDVKPYFAGYNNQQEVSFQIITQLVKKQIEQYYGGTFDVLDVYPRNIAVSFSQIVFKKVAVKFKGDIHYEPQFWQKGDIVIAPDSIEIGGPKAIIDSVRYIFTEKITRANVNKQTSFDVKIDHRNIFEISKKEVNITLDAEKFTESSIKVPIRVLNAPSRYNVMLFPDYVTVKFLVALSEYEHITAANFLPIVDYNRMITTGGKEKIKIDMVEQPEKAKNISIHPREVNYIIGLKR